METSMSQSDTECTKGASPSAYCNDGPLKGNKLFASTAGLKKPVFQHNTIKNELIFLFLQQLYIFTHP